MPGTAPEPKFHEYEPILEPVTGVDPEETKLNEMMKAYKDSQQKATEYNEERKMKAHADSNKKKKELCGYVMLLKKVN